jgi:hypothetical protein
MRIPEPLKYLSGSIAIYYIMAACSSPSGGGPGATAKSGSSGGSSGSTSSASGSGGTTSSSGAASSSGTSSSGATSSGSPVPDANADETQSGSRLKANYYVGGDGSKQFVGYFTDTARNNEHCYFSTAADGSTRCLPIVGDASANYSGGPFFSDAACTTTIALSSCSTPAYVAENETGGGCPVAINTHIFALGSTYAGTVYQGGATTCTAVTASALKGYVLFSVGPEVPASSFQQATIQTD